MPPVSSPLSFADAQPSTLVAFEEATRLIARLDGRISGSFVRQPWAVRAGWSGFAAALRLQGGEVDDIDIFSWGCGVPIPHRPRRTSHLDDHDAFGEWACGLARTKGGAWRDALPFTPAIATDQPILIRALDVVREYALHSAAADPWLLLPILLRQFGATEVLLPCLVAGAKLFRDRRRVPQDVIRAALRMLSAQARQGLLLLDGLERGHRRAARTLLGERRPGALRPLAALSMVRPVLTPVSVAADLGLSLSGAGKLLDRAAGLELLCEISGRATWKTYLAPDLAMLLGFVSPPRGRPRAEPAFPTSDAEMAAMLAAFDRDMAAFDARFGISGTLPADED